MRVPLTCIYSILYIFTSLRRLRRSVLDLEKRKAVWEKFNHIPDGPEPPSLTEQLTNSSISVTNDNAIIYKTMCQLLKLL